MPTETGKDIDRFDLSKLEPSTREDIIASLKAGIGVVGTAKALSVSHHTVQQVRESLAETDPELYCLLSRKTHAAALQRAANLGIQRIGESMATVPIESARDLQSVSVSVAILTDKALLLSGQPNNITAVEHRLSIDRSAFMQALQEGQPIDIDAMPAAQAEEASTP